MDGKHIIFGLVVKGIYSLFKMKRVETFYKGKLKQKIYIKEVLVSKNPSRIDYNFPRDE